MSRLRFLVALAMVLSALPAIAPSSASAVDPPPSDLRVLTGSARLRARGASNTDPRFTSRPASLVVAPRFLAPAPDDQTPDDLGPALDPATAAPRASQPAAAPRQPVCPENVGWKPLSALDLDPAPSAGPLPLDCSELLDAAPEFATSGRAFMPTAVTWRPSCLHHDPLYFDDLPLERYGQTPAPLLQPAISGARFYTSLLILPYKAGLDPPWCKVPDLGFPRPGECVPTLRRRLPLTLRAEAFQAAATVGLIYLIP